MQGEVYRWEGHGWISNQMREYYDIPELNVEEYDFKEPRFADFLKSYPQFPGILEKSRSARWVIKKPHFSDSASVSKEKRKKMFSDLFSVLLYNSKNE